MKNMISNMLLFFSHLPRRLTLYLLSYLLVFIIPAISSCLSYDRICMLIEQDERQAYATELNGIAQFIDEQFQQANLLANNMSYSRRIQSYQLSSYLDDSDAAYISYDALGEFRTYRTTYNSIENFFVYFSSDASILTGSGKYTATQFFHYAYSIIDYESTQIEQMILSYQNAPLFLSSPVINKNNILQGPLFPYVYTLNIPYAGPLRYANLVVLISKNALINYIGKTDIGLNGSIFILDSDNKAFITLDNGSVNFDQLTNDTAYVNNYIINKMQTKYSKVSIISAVPISILQNKFSAVRSTMKFTLYMSIFFGLAIACFFAFSNYNTVCRIANIFKKYQDEVIIDRKYDELQYITSAAQHISKKAEQAEHLLVTQAPVLCAALVKNILSGQMLNFDKFIGSLENYGYWHSASFYFVGIISIKKYESLSLADQHLMLHELQNIMLMVCGNQIGCILISDDDDRSYSYLMSNNNSDICQYRSLLLSICNKIETLLSLCVNIYASMPVSSLQSVFYAKKQAESIYRRHAVSKANKVYVFGDSDEDTPLYFEFSIDTENQLVNLVRSSDEQEVGRMVLQVVSRNLSLEGLNDFMIYSFKNSLVNTGVKLFVELENKNVSTRSAYAYLDKLIEAGKNDLAEEALNLFIQICRLYKSLVLTNDSIGEYSGAIAQAV